MRFKLFGVKMNKLTLKMIKEEIESVLSVESLEDLEPIEDAFAGGNNLHLNINHESITNGETNDKLETTSVYRMSESRLREIVRKVISS